MNVLDMFAGAAGGWSKGLALAGYRTVAACEIDDWRRAVFAAQHRGCRMYADVRELTAARLERDLGFLPDVIVGSPPCQEISTANCKGAGITDDHLFWEWARLTLDVRPLWCAAENSPNARLAGIDGILDALDQAGYAAWPCVVGADHAGANHRRRRLWLIAADATRLGRAGSMGCTAGGPQERPRPAGHALPDARHAQKREGLRRRRVLGRSGTEPAQADLHDAADPDGEGRTIGSRLPGNDGEELPAALRDIGLAWPHWNGGLAGLAAACAAAGFGALDDGPRAGLPAGLRNRAIAALGDAVIPQITYEIGKAMRTLTDGAEETP